MAPSVDQLPIDDEAENAELQEQVKLAEAQIVEQSKRIEYYLTDYSVELFEVDPIYWTTGLDREDGTGC